jgi:hypothetical protein
MAESKGISDIQAGAIYIRTLGELLQKSKLYGNHSVFDKIQEDSKRLDEIAEDLKRVRKGDIIAASTNWGHTKAYVGKFQGIVSQEDYLCLSLLDSVELEESVVSTAYIKRYETSKKVPVYKVLSIARGPKDIAALLKNRGYFSVKKYRERVSEDAA